MEAPRGAAFLGKRKEREYHYPWSSSSSSSGQAALLRPQPLARPDPRGRPEVRPAARPGAKAPLAPPLPLGAAQAVGTNNKLLAGYLAHEFLRCGTLLGERRLQPPPGGKEKEPAGTAAPAPEPAKRYAEVSRLLMAGGARIPGIVNPAQLGRWLRIKE
ncbi:hypothetical protein ACP70R_026633 [Stipagrostis hirtigluma subsp. patula]